MVAATRSDSARVRAALYLAHACHAWSHEGGLYDHIFSSDFQIPGHVLCGLGILEIPEEDGYPGSFRWLVDEPGAFQAVIERNLDTGPTHEEVLIALAFCFIDLADELFDFLVTEGAFEATKEIVPNVWGKPIAWPVPTPYGRELEQRWLHWWDEH